MVVGDELRRPARLRDLIYLPHWYQCHDEKILMRDGRMKLGVDGETRVIGLRMDGLNSRNSRASLPFVQRQRNDHTRDRRSAWAYKEGYVVSTVTWAFNSLLSVQQVSALSLLGMSRYAGTDSSEILSATTVFHSGRRAVHSMVFMLLGRGINTHKLGRAMSASIKSRYQPTNLLSRRARQLRS